MPLNPLFDGINLKDLEELKIHLDAAGLKRPMNTVKRMKQIKVFEEESRALIVKGDNIYIRGIVYISEEYVEFGWFKPSPNNIIISLDNKTNGIAPRPFVGISREALHGLIYSNRTGYYIYNNKFNPIEVLYHKSRGQGNFPYQFPKRYEAAESFHIFKGAQQVLGKEQYPLAKYLKYTFGLEFETSMGYIPQEKCFRDGLIPLRDGSITGIEYSTVVLEGNMGLNLLRQQVDTLKEYTKFNKECALHIHMGGFPVDPISIYALYSLWYAVERDLEQENYVPKLTFHTDQYKYNGKDYCKMLEGDALTFSSLFEKITGTKYFGSLVQPHPADIEKRAKWNIKTRYYGLNLVNMLCYTGPKTVEFRFLRPTFNYRKITLWLYILNAILKYAEELSDNWKSAGKCDTKGMMAWILTEHYKGIMYILKQVYDADTFSYLDNEIILLKMAVKAQYMNGDRYGRDIEFEEELFT